MSDLLKKEVVFLLSANVCACVVFVVFPISSFGGKTPSVGESEPLGDADRGDCKSFPDGKELNERANNCCSER